MDEGSFSAGKFDDNVDKLKKGLIAIAQETGQSFSTLNQGLFDLISAGVPAEKALVALKTSAELAIAGATETSIAVDGITSALGAYEIQSDQARIIAEKFFTAQKFGKTTIGELSGGIGLVAASAAEAGISFDELLAATAASTTSGIKTNAAYTGLKAAIANVIRPTKEAKDEAKRLGIEFSASALRSQGLKGFLDQVTQSVNFNEDSISKLFASQEALNVVLALSGAAHDDFAKILAANNDELSRSKTFNDALAKASDTSSIKIQKLKLALDAAAVALGEFIAPPLIFFLEQTAKRITQLTVGLGALKDILVDVVKLISLGLFGEEGVNVSGVASFVSNPVAFAARRTASGVSAAGAIAAGANTQTNSVNIDNINVNAPGGDSREIAQNVAAATRDQFQNTVQDFDSSFAR